MLRKMLADAGELASVRSNCWPLYLVGDVHQPPHATSRFNNAETKGDEGGNDVKICCALSCNGANELHAFGMVCSEETTRHRKTPSRQSTSCPLPLASRHRSHRARSRWILLSATPMGPFSGHRQERAAIRDSVVYRELVAGMFSG